MSRPSAALLLVVLLPLQGLAQPLGLPECRALRERRNQLAAAAMQAEIALVLATRRRLCPRQEALAEQANAGASRAEAAGSSGPQGQSADAGGRPADAAWVEPAAPAVSRQAGSPPTTTLQADPSQAAAPQLDYSAYLQCRRQAETQLRRSRTILYTNQNGFTFYTLDGARLARDADAWQQRLRASCAAGGGG